MSSGVPQAYESLFSDSLAVSRRPLFRAGGKIFRAGNPTPDRRATHRKMALTSEGGAL